MGVRTHEVHAALVHTPLTLIPLAALVDLAAVLRGRRAGRASASRAASLGAELWLAAGAGGLLAGATGLAASQEVHYPTPVARDMTFVHAAGNEGVLAGVLGLAAWRRTHRPTWGSALAGLAVTAAVFYTAYLGGEMVYQHQVGVEGMDGPEAQRRSPPLLSAVAPLRLLGDAARGVRWLLNRALALPGEGLTRGAVGGSSGEGAEAALTWPDPHREASQAWRG